MSIVKRKKVYYIFIALILILCSGCARKRKDLSVNDIENQAVMDNKECEENKGCQDNKECEDNKESDENKESKINKDLPEYSKLYPDMYVTSNICELEEDGKKIAYLTFDDGPSKYTNDLLEILNKYNVKATFFILGSTMTKEGEECLRTMVKEGHTIGLHTYSHKYREIYQSVEAFLSDMYKIYQKVYEITGIKANIFRFPSGSSNCYIGKIKHELIDEMERRGFIYYDWNVTAEDSVGKPSEYSIKSNILKHFNKHNKPVILMHDSSINKLTIKVLPQIIEEIKAAGYDFDTLDQRTPCHFRK